MGDDAAHIEVTVAVSTETKKVHLGFGPMDAGDVVWVIHHIATRPAEFAEMVLEHLTEALLEVEGI
jgi:hypothetical protein